MFINIAPPPGLPGIILRIRQFFECLFFGRCFVIL